MRANNHSFDGVSLAGCASRTSSKSQETPPSARMPPFHSGDQVVVVVSNHFVHLTWQDGQCRTRASVKYCGRVSASGR